MSERSSEARFSDTTGRLTIASGRNDRRRCSRGGRLRDGKNAHSSNVTASEVGKAVLGAQRLTLVGASARGSASRDTAGAGGGNTGEGTRGERENLGSRNYQSQVVYMSQNGSWLKVQRHHDQARGLQWETKSKSQRAGKTQGKRRATLGGQAEPSNRPESSRTTDPGAGSERVGVVHVSATESASENGRPSLHRWSRAAVLDWWGSNGRRETRRSTNVLESSGNCVEPLAKSCKLGQGCVERVQIFGARHDGTSTTPQRKGKTNAPAIATEHCKCSGKSSQPTQQQGQGAERPRQATVTGDQQHQEKTAQRTERPQGRGAERPSPAAQTTDVCKSKPLKPQPVEIEHMADSVNV